MVASNICNTFNYEVTPQVEALANKIEWVLLIKHVLQVVKLAMLVSASGYVLEKRLTSEDKWVKVVTLEPTVTLHLIENLKDKSEYFFRAYAENSIGLSPPAGTDIVALKTHASELRFSPHMCKTKVNNISLCVSNAIADIITVYFTATICVCI